jgi:hypothetical protein
MTPATPSHSGPLLVPLPLLWHFSHKFLITGVQSWYFFFFTHPLDIFLNTRAEEEERGRGEVLMPPAPPSQMSPSHSGTWLLE